MPRKATPPPDPELPKRPNRTGSNINAWIEQDIADAMDTYIEDQVVPPKKNAILSVALRRFFQAVGYLAKDPVLKGQTDVSLTPVSPTPFRLPYVGPVSAGTPIEVFDQGPDEWFDFTSVFGGDGKYVFKVKGKSMVDFGLYDGDFAVIRRTPTARSGEVVVAVVDGALTIKKLVTRARQTLLFPCNGEDWHISLDAARGDRVIGALVGSVRKQEYARG